jgi:4-diphosphocytidyl-2-C-methyl-D-erythritol kinase
MTEQVRWEAPAKINLSLELRPRDGQGLHPLRSLVQAIEWNDLLDVTPSDEDELRIDGADLPDGGDNLVWRAIAELRREIGIDRPAMSVTLTKRIPMAAGLGGGSSDAAAALMAAASIMRVAPDVAKEVAPRIGADVPFFLHGGSLWTEGYGEQLTPARLPDDYAVAIAVPDFELRTADVYQAWDRMGEPAGQEISVRRLPPKLRSVTTFRNDLTAAAIHVRPELGDWIEELSDLWERPALMTGSGPALFAFFEDLDEAEGAASAVSKSARSTRAVVPRDRGAQRLATE